MSTLLVGSATVFGSANSCPGGSIEAFSYVATANGVIDTLMLLTGATANSCSSVSLAVYADTAGRPSALLGSGTFTGSPPPGTWIAVSGLRASVTGGTRYWLALNPVGGTLNFRDGALGGSTNIRTTAGSFTNPPSTFPTTTSTASNVAASFQGLQVVVTATVQISLDGTKQTVPILVVPDTSAPVPVFPPIIT